MCSLLLHDMINHLVWAYISVSVSICQVMYGNKQAQNSIIFRKKNGFLTLQVHYRLLEQSLLVLVTQRRGTHTQAYPVVAQGSLNSRACLQRDGLRNLCRVPSQVSPPVTLGLQGLFAARCHCPVPFSPSRVWGIGDYRQPVIQGRVVPTLHPITSARAPA